MKTSRTGSDANAIPVARSQTLAIKPQRGLCVRCLSGRIRVVQHGVAGEHFLPAGTGYRAAADGPIEVESCAGDSLIALGRAGPSHLPGVGAVYIDSDAALSEGARRLRFSFLTAFLRRHG